MNYAFGELIRQMDWLALNPDADWDCARLVQLIADSVLAEQQFAELVERYGNSPTLTIVRALAASTVAGKESGRAIGNIEQILRFAELLEVEDANTLSLCLEALTNRIFDAENRHLLGCNQIQRLGRFLVQCCDFEGDQSYLVAIGVVDLLDKLLFLGYSLFSFTSNHVAVLRNWLSGFLKRETEGPFAEQARAILEEISSAG